MLVLSFLHATFVDSYYLEWTRMMYVYARFLSGLSCLLHVRCRVFFAHYVVLANILCVEFNVTDASLNVLFRIIFACT